MASKKILFSLAVLILTGGSLGFPANLVLKDQTSIELILDFAFDRILVGRNYLECSDKTQCLIIDDTEKSDTYHNVAYSYKTAAVTINISGAEIVLPLRLNSSGLNVFGVSPLADYATAFKGNPGVSINMLTGDIALINNKSNSFKLDYHDQTKTLYIQSALQYNYRYGPAVKAVQNQAKLCLQNGRPTPKANYFFLADYLFLVDWDSFLQTTFLVQGGKFADTQNIKMGSDPNTAVTLTYGYQLFESYDRAPIKKCSAKEVAVCDLFVGNYFAQRGGLKLLLSGASNDNALEARLAVDQQDYEVYFHIDYMWFLNMAVVLSFWVIIISLCCGECLDLKFKEPAPERLLG